MRSILRDRPLLGDALLGAVDGNLIHEQWDQMVRVAVALKNRNAPPEVVVQRLARACRMRPVGVRVSVSSIAT